MRRRKNDIIKVATFNLYNLVLPETRYYGRRSYTKEAYAYKKGWINHQLKNMDADIVGFQEIFHEEALKDVISANSEYKDAHMVVAGANGNGPTVGLLSRFPITDWSIISTFPEQLEVKGLKIPFTNFSRPVLKARVQISKNQHLIVFVAHLKSKRPMLSEGADREDPIELAKGKARSLLLRAAEAGALRTILMETLQHRDHPVIAMGDLNDTGTSVTTQIISGDTPWRQMPMDKKLKYWDVLLYHAKDIQARQSFKDVYYTHIHNGHYESLDHIMVSQELVRENPNRIGRVGFVKVFNDHLIDQTLSEDRVESWKSDHAQVVVSLEMKDPVDRL
ncbi:MAG: endonuclease/exonuclease/phosphatase family protein [Saprospiraceae bacterium]|nr:endonuclease/exonuclease/phosphatase family protein [Saprospiraceae bacterium]